jgi:hypothetical protein
MRETLYRHCKFSANFRFRKMFYPDYSYFDYLSILLIAIPCYSFEF